jgi:hypothetical protein
MLPVRHVAFVCALLAGCVSRGSESPAADGVKVYLKALRQNEPKAAYRMLSEDTRKELSFKEFELLWKESRAERQLQARALEEGLQGNDDLGERAQIKFRDGKTASLQRERGKWRLEAALLSQSHAGSPRDAVRIFAEALQGRDYDGVMRILTSRRRDGIAKQLDGFTTSLLDHLSHEISKVSKDRAELSWDDRENRYKLVLYREGDEWRIDDVHIRPAPEEPKKDEPSK